MSRVTTFKAPLEQLFRGYGVYRAEIETENQLLKIWVESRSWRIEYWNKDPKDKEHLLLWEQDIFFAYDKDTLLEYMPKGDWTFFAYFPW